MTIRSYYSKEAARPSQSPTVTALPEGEPRAYAPPDAPCERPLPPSAREVSTRSVDGGRDVVRAHLNEPSVGGDAHIAPFATAAPRHQASLVQRRPSAHTGVGIRPPFYASGGVLLPSAAKVPKNAVQTCGLKIPHAPSHGLYLVKINHANTVPCKLPLNVALSLLLGALPLLL